MDYLVSVIITCYNVDKYLSKCIESVMNQTYRNIEIIIVDDGSRDKSGYICDYYEGQDDRIRLVHQNNVGPGNARNRGLELAKGEYIFFVDGDDYLEPDAIEILLNEIYDNATDMAIIGINDHCKGGNHHESDNKRAGYTGEGHESGVHSSTTRKVLYNDELLRKLVFDNAEDIRPQVWNKMYKAELLKDLEFPNRKFYEDVLFTMGVLTRAKSAIYITDKLYNFNEAREDGVSESGYIREILIDRLKVHKQQLEFLEKNNRPELMYPLKYNFYIKLLESYDEEKKKGNDGNELYIEDLVAEIEKCDEDFYRIFHCEIAERGQRKKMSKFLRHRRFYNFSLK